MNASVSEVPDAVVDAESRRARWVDWIDARINPVLVRDLRLWMRGIWFVGGYLVILALSILGSIFTVATVRAREGDGSELFLWVFLLLFSLVGGVIPYFVHERFRAELASRATELALLSTLTPARLVNGKLQSAACASLLAFSLALPAWSTAYLLGGVDPPVMLYALALVVIAGVATPSLQIALATLGSALWMRGLSLMVMAVVIATGEMFCSYEGRLSLAGNFVSDIWVHLLHPMVALAVGAALFANFLRIVSIARLRPWAGNPVGVPRLTLFLSIIGGGALSLLILWHYVYVFRGGLLSARSFYGGWSGYWTMQLAATIGLGMMAMFLAGLLILEFPPGHEVPSRRLRRDWPRWGLLRWVGYPGPGRLSAYVLLAQIPLAAAAYLALSLVGEGGRGESIVRQGQVFSGVVYYALVVGLSMHLLVIRPLCRKWGQPSPGAAVSIVWGNLVAGLVTGIGVLLMEMGHLAPVCSPWFHAASPFGLIRYDPGRFGGNVPDSILSWAAIPMVVLTIPPVVAAVLAWLEGRRFYRERLAREAQAASASAPGDAGASPETSS